MLVIVRLAPLVELTSLGIFVCISQTEVNGIAKLRVIRFHARVPVHVLGGLIGHVAIKQQVDVATERTNIFAELLLGLGHVLVNLAK